MAGSPAFERLLAEMAEQPDVVARVAEKQAAAAARIAGLLKGRPPVVLAARGSSDHAAVYGRYLFETRNRLLTSLAAPSTVTLYGAGPDLRGAVVFGVSQSGQSADIVAYLEEARRQGAATVAIVNETASPLARAAEHVLGCAAGAERSIPATKSLLAEMSLLALVSLCASGDDPAEAFAGVPAALARALEMRPRAAPIAALLSRCEGLSILGRGLAFPVALELALKLKETSDARAEPFSSADFLHGPVTLLDADHAAVLVDVGGPTSAAALDLSDLAQRRGAQAVLVRAGRLKPQSSSRFALEVEAAVPDALAPLVAVVLGQQLAVELAITRGLDPGVPRGLSKVTSTR